MKKIVMQTLSIITIELANIGIDTLEQLGKLTQDETAQIKNLPVRQGGIKNIDADNPYLLY